MKCQILFSRKSKKNITNLSSAESTHSVVSVNICMLKLNLKYKYLYKFLLSEIYNYLHFATVHDF